MSRREPRHLFRFIGIAAVIALCLPLVLLLGFFAAPVLLLFIPAFFFWGAEKTTLEKPEHDLVLRRAPRSR